MTTTKTETQTKSLQKTYGKIVLTLENCILSELEKPTPSELDGLDRETETDLRILGCELIQTAGILLKLPQVAMATGQVLFQRFFYSKSFVRHSMEATAMSCICLASKIEEAPRRVRDVINVFHHIKQVRAQKPLTPVILDQNYINLKSQVIKAERRVLKELGFCVHVKHPHKLIVMYLKYLELEQHQQIMQLAWNYMNDSFRTDAFVRYQPEKIACACIYLTARKLGIQLPNNPPWYGVFKATEEEITDICYRILALYKRSKTQIEKLEIAVEQLKHAYQEQRKKDKPGQSTPPAVTTVDRNNGSHNAWGGFIQRALPVTNTSENEKTEKSPSRKKSKSRSRSRSKSTSPSRTPPDEKHYHRKRSRNRSRSRSPLNKKSKKQSRHYSRSSSESPQRVKHKKSDKKYDKRSPDRDRYTNGDRIKSSRDYDRDYDYKNDYKSDYKSYKDSSSYKGSYKEYKEYKEYKDYNRGREKDRYDNGGKDKYIRSNKHRDRSPRDRRR